MRLPAPTAAEIAAMRRRRAVRPPITTTNR